jgi:hypothetical protein
MSQTTSATTADLNFQSTFNDAVKTYNEKTKRNITEDPLLASLQLMDRKRLYDFCLGTQLSSGRISVGLQHYTKS